MPEQLFSRRKEDYIYSALSALKNRMVEHHRSPPITTEQVYEALVRPEHQHKLREIDQLVGVIQRHASASTKIPLPNHSGLIGVAFLFSSSLNRLLPAYVQNGFHEHANRDLVDEVTSWVKRRFEIGASFALAKAAFRKINREITNMSQMRIYFPGILALMNMTGEESLVARAAKYAEAPTPSSLPNLHPELRRTLMDTTKLIARAQLCPAEPPPRGEVTLAIGFGSMGNIEMPWDRESKAAVD